MAGGLMQLVAYGAQDVYLTGNPQITFFKIVYRRHTNFSVEAIEQTFNGTPDYGKKVSCTISRNGDLIYRMYLEATLPAVDTSGTSTLPFTDASNIHWVNYVGERLIDYIEVEIGGQRIDKHYGEWLHIWNQLTLQPGQEYAYQRMVGNVPRLTANYRNNNIQTVFNDKIIPQTRLYIPLQFWFCRNPGLALPLIALQYHEVKINIQFQELAKLFCIIPKTSPSTGPTTPTLGSGLSQIPSLVGSSLWVDYVFLDTDERRRFAQLSHEYLIEQLQYPGEETIMSSANSKIKLNFNHPVKEIIWVTQKAVSQTFLQWYNYTDALDPTPTFTNDPLGSNLVFGLLECYTAITPTTSVNDNGVNTCAAAKIQLNGQDRFAERTGDYFNYVQPYQHHTRNPHLGINVYSFALNPEQHQPTGSCNFSRIDNANLLLGLTSNSVRTGTITYNPFNSIQETAITTGTSANAYCRVYATNYNVLRIMSGMGGLAYSN
jgi:hypothetical protein